MTTIGAPPERLPRLGWRDRVNELRLDAKFRLVPFRGYYRYRSRKYMRRSAPDMALLRFLAHPEKASLDVGANLGLFAHVLARLTPHVHAFEPNPVPLRILHHVADRNVTVHALALGDETGEATLAIPRGRKGWSSNGARIASACPPGGIAIRVPMARLDALDLGPIGLIKIDVEGGELAVLEGARATIARDRPALFVENEAVHAGDRMSRLFQRLDDFGYDGLFLANARLESLRRFSLERHQRAPRAARDEMGYVKNFIFLPR